MKKILFVLLIAVLVFSSLSCLANEVADYGKSLNLPPEVVETLVPLGKDGIDENEKALVDAIYFLPQEVQVSETVQNLLSEIAQDTVVASEELDRFKDLDQDGLSNQEELKRGTDLLNPDSDDDGLGDGEEILALKTDPLEPNLNVKYAIDKGILDYLNQDNIMEYLTLISLLPEDFAKYAIENKLGIQDCVLTELESKFLEDPNNYDEELFDCYVSEVNNINPELSNELLKLPDFQEIDIKDIEVLEDIVDLAKNKSVFGTSFDFILEEGIKDERKYCSPLEALIWLLYDYDKECLNSEICKWSLPKVYSSRLLEKRELMRLVLFSWEVSSSSGNYGSRRWIDFDEVIDRLNSPVLVRIYMVLNISYDMEKFAGIKQESPYWATPEETFERKKGVCVDQGRFAFYCLFRNGYEYDNFDKWDDHAACMFEAYNPAKPPSNRGHLVCLYIESGKFYTIDGGWIKGPFNTVEEAADATWRDWTAYNFFDVNCRLTKRFTSR